MKQEILISLEMLKTEMKKDDIPSDVANSVLDLLGAVPRGEWGLLGALSYVEALVFANKLTDPIPSDVGRTYLDAAYDAMQEVSQEGANSYDWNSSMANICYNMQMYEDAVYYQTMAAKLCGTYTEQPLNELYEQVMHKLGEQVADLSDMEILALYANGTE